MTLDPPRPLPVRSLALWLAFLVVAQIAAAYGLTAHYGWAPEVRTGIVAGGLTSLSGCAIAILVLRPWRPRPAATWTVHWMGATTVRFLFTPVALFSVYSATLLPGPAVFLGGVAAYLAALTAESVVIAKAMLGPGPSSPPERGW